MLCIVYYILFVFILQKHGISYGGILQEARYLVNYTFTILNLFLYCFVFSEEDSETKLKKVIRIAFLLYVIILYISLITGTSSSTYLEGIGQKGWFETGNSISSVLLIGFFVLLPTIKKSYGLSMKNRILTASSMILAGGFLVRIVGTRVGLLGVLLVLGAYLFSEIFVSLKSKEKINKKVIAIVVSSIAVVLLAAAAGSATLERRQYLNSIAGDVVDASTEEASHVTGDTLNLLAQVEENEGSQQEEFGEYLSEPTQKALKSLYEYANQKGLVGTDRRMQQLVFHTYLARYQQNVWFSLFGNGFLASYGELILEMEIPALFLNFGYFGFCLFFLPFVIAVCYGSYMGVKHFAKIDVEYMMYLFGILFSFALSMLAGYVFFYTSTGTMIVILTVLLKNKVDSWKEGNN